MTPSLQNDFKYLYLIEGLMRLCLYEFVHILQQAAFRLLHCNFRTTANDL